MHRDVNDYPGVAWRGLGDEDRLQGLDAELGELAAVLLGPDRLWQQVLPTSAPEVSETAL